ncbi:MAG: hypothetical protein ACKVQR_06360 [Aquabacterium sp.]
MVETREASSLLHGDLGVSLPLPTAGRAIRVVPGLRILSLRHLPGGAAALNAAVAAHGLTPLPEPGTFRGADPWLLWVAPAELLLLTTSSAVADGVLQALTPGREALACVLDQSAGCLVIELKGDAVADVLLHLLDVSAVPQQPGRGTRTRLMDVGAVVLRLETDRVFLVMDRAHGVYVAQWIKHALGAEGPVSDVLSCARR